MNYDEERQQALEDGLLADVNEERAKEFAKRGWRFDALFSPAKYLKDQFETEIPEGAIVLQGDLRPAWMPEETPSLDIDRDEVFSKREYLAKEDNLPFEIEESSVFNQEEPYIHLLDKE